MYVCFLGRFCRVVKRVSTRNFLLLSFAIICILIRINSHFIAGHRWLCLPCLRALGQEGRGPEPGRPLREYSAHRAARALHQQSQPIGGGRATGRGR